MLACVLRTFAELAKTPRIAELNLTNGIFTQCVRILSDAKFTKEPKLWALVIINRCCMIQLNQINSKTVEICLGYLSPTFINFLLRTLNPEETDFTMNSKGIYTTMELMAAAKN